MSSMFLLKPKLFLLSALFNKCWMNECFCLVIRCVIRLDLRFLFLLLRPLDVSISKTSSDPFSFCCFVDVDEIGWYDVDVGVSSGWWRLVLRIDFVGG